MCSRGWERRLVRELLPLPLLLLVISVQGHLEQKLIVVTNGNVTLPVFKGLPNDYIRLTWFYTDSQKIVEYESNSTKYFDSKFKSRVKLDQSGALHIYYVQKEDSSTYRLIVKMRDRQEEKSKVSLEVLDPVPKPNMTTEKTEEGNHCFLKLSCVTPEQSVNYTWYGDSGPFPQALQGSVLHLTVTPQNYSTFYTCQVSNPVSSENDTVYFTLPCTLARSTGADWIASWLLAMVPTIAGLLLV
ncbi:CD48 antigen [Carlito syrichta]|uniref:CD48 antigen n=1 Tax=Carlito syrichta TaxID=1868482 RepID=A0A3Q0DVZ0_CARSF|nr:CD48 antigen [Carlito syrichta]